jgi:transposase
MVSRRRKSRLPASIQIELIRHFVAGSSARSVAEICGINRNTAILYFHKLRELIANRLTAEAPDCPSSKSLGQLIA